MTCVYMDMLNYWGSIVYYCELFNKNCIGDCEYYIKDVDGDAE